MGTLATALIREDREVFTADGPPDGLADSAQDRLPALRVLQVDPSLFTAPYDAALSRGLQAAGVEPVWATRRLRCGEEEYLADVEVRPFFYRLTDGPRRRSGSLWQSLKGAEHLLALKTLVRAASDFDLVHFQWAPLPLFDRRAAAIIARTRPVVMTVHDIDPFNGRSVGALQRNGYHAMIATADRLIVHSEAGRTALRSRGVKGRRIAVVPHGLLPLASQRAEPRTNDRWRILLFGRIQDYKGVDLLIEALGQINRSLRDRIEVVVAGEMLVSLDPLVARAAALGLGDSFVLRPGRLPEGKMAALLRSADAFVFPYRSIDASGVLHLVAPLDRWLIASDLGAFRTMLGAVPDAGTLIPPANVGALARALVDSIDRQPTRRLGLDVPSWEEIGAATRAVYASAIAERGARS